MVKDNINTNSNNKIVGSPNDIKTLKKKLKNITDQIDDELKNGDNKRKNRSPDLTTKSLNEDQIQESFHFPPLLAKNESLKSIDIKIEYQKER